MLPQPSDFVGSIHVEVGPPAILFFDVRGREAGALKVIGFQAAQRFSAQLERALVELGQTLVKP